MRGEQESCCLAWVKEHLYGPDTRFFCHDKRKIAAILKRAKPNLEASKFPDFVFEDGFIEHFQITASKENKKGSCHKQTQAEFHREMDFIHDKLRQELEQTPLPVKSTISTTSCEMIPPEYSYEMYQEAFRKHWEHHIHSLESYPGARKNGIFLVECQGALLKIIRNGQFVDFYHLHMDAPMLHYMQAYQDRLSYVVFVDGYHCEIIELQQISDLIERVPRDISFEAGRYRELQIFSVVDIMNAR